MDGSGAAVADGERAGQGRGVDSSGRHGTRARGPDGRVSGTGRHAAVARVPAPRRAAEDPDGPPTDEHELRFDGPEFDGPEFDGRRFDGPGSGASPSGSHRAVAPRPREEPRAGRRRPRRAAPAVDHVLRAVDLVRVHGRGRGAVRALDGVSLDVERGGLVAVMGASGSGKSTLLHCLAGLDRPTSGSVLWDGAEITRLSERRLTRLRRERVGVVFQAYDLLPQLTVRQNVGLPAEIAGVRLDRGRLDEVLDVLDLGAVRGHRPDQLSGGQQQRVAVARALVLQPDLLLADEPTGALDVGTAAVLLGHLRSCVEAGRTVVMATHDPLAAEWADRVLLLHEGRIVTELAAPSAHEVLDALAQVRRPPRRRRA